MFGISYGQLFLLIGATAALAAGRLTGRSIGYVQLAQGQFDNAMQQSQVRQVQKELQDTMAQLDAIQYEIRSLSLINPGPMSRILMENLQSPLLRRTIPPEKREGEKNSDDAEKKDYNVKILASVNLYSQATAYARLADSEAVRDFTVLPVSAESAGLLPDRKESVKGSDIVLEAMVEAEVAPNAKDFSSQSQNKLQ